MLRQPRHHQLIKSLHVIKTSTQHHPPTHFPPSKPPSPQLLHPNSIHHSPLSPSISFYQSSNTMAAVNRAPCTMMSANSQKSQVVGNRVCSVSRICVTPRMELSGGFRDLGHVLYYKKGITAVKMASCGGLVAEKDMKKDQKKNMKKKIKLLKGLTKDLSMLSQAEMVGETDPNGISRAAETLMQHLEEMKSKEKEVKKRRKMEKSMMKAAKAAQCGQSSSSESCECGEVVNLASMRMKTVIKPEVPKELSEVVSIITHSNIPPQLENETNKLSISNVVETVNKKIEVCMGGKCKKSGAVQLVEEFEKIVGEGTVVGCKCMGKCRDGPNVRVLSNGANASDLGKIQADLSPPPLCIGVGLEDVGVIVANFLGGGSSTSCSNQSSFAVAAAT